MAAAVADYTPETTCTEKIKKTDDDLSIKLKRTKDILKHLGKTKKDGQIIVGFAMETENMIENAAKKLKSKNCDMICANNLKTEGAGFGTDTNVITIITEKETKTLPKMTKDEASHKIFDEIKIL
jgi:phosphopantothenoylcysteine decarboxylase/phosphopantothenate--cysteine ligase